MKKLILLLLLTWFYLCGFGQKKFIGIDLGYQFGKNQYFETGINFTRLFGKVGGSLSIGIEDNVNAKNFGYKLGISGFSTNKIPFYFGLDLVKNNVDDKDFYSMRPEIGFGAIGSYSSSGISVIKLTYGYNFALANPSSQLNTHFMRFSINTNLMGIIRLFGFWF